MGGDVQVRSCPGQGCTFTLEVRLEIVEGGPGPKSGTPCPAEEGIAAPAPAAGPLQGLRVLVAEDDAAGRYLLEVRLREQGCTVGLAADGEQVLDMLAAAAWDVILLDAGMPRMDGLTVLERIRAGQSAASRQQAVIVHSAGLAPGEEARFRSLGVRALLDKPVPRPCCWPHCGTCPVAVPATVRQGRRPVVRRPRAPRHLGQGGRTGGRGSGRGAAAYPGHGLAGGSAASGRSACSCPETGRRSRGPGGPDGGGPAPGGPCPEEFRGHALF